MARQRQRKLGAALLIVTVIGLAGVYFPARRAIAETQTLKVEIDAQLLADQQRASALPELIDAVTDLRRQVDRFKPLRGTSDIQQALEQITAIKNDTSLQNYKFETIDEVRKLATCQEYRVRITFQADFIDAMSFVRKVEAMDRLTRVRELRIIGRREANVPASGRVTVDMALSLFFRPADR